MKKLVLGNKEFIALDDIKFALRNLRNNPEIWPGYTEEQQTAVVTACNHIIRQIFLEDIKAAKTQFEIDAIVEMTGDFVVYKPIGKKKAVFFQEWKGGEAVFAEHGNEAMVFSYESKAKEIAENLGGEWRVCDIGRPACDYRKRLLAAIFQADDDFQEGDEE